MKKFPKIVQFVDVIRRVRSRHDFKGYDDQKKPIYSHDSPYPTYDFIGKPKLHGTNGSFSIDEDGKIDAIFARNREISLAEDNAGFCAFIEGNRLLIETSELSQLHNCVVFGEYAGKGIQKGVAIAELEKMFVVFGVYDKTNDKFIDFSTILNSPLGKIYSINQFPSFSVRIDFEHPENAQNIIVDMVTDVENECPVGKVFGVSGIGEGIVFSRTDDLSSEFYFKAKGLKFLSTKVKTIASVDVEKLNSINEFVEYACTENRMCQGMDEMRKDGVEITRQSTGIFMSWLINDILTEEGPAMCESGLCKKDIGSALCACARRRYSQECEKFWKR
ncbi:MAG: RNA ligase family protein [Ghiorsea sp.]